MILNLFSEITRDKSKPSSIQWTKPPEDNHHFLPTVSFNLPGPQVAEDVLVVVRSEALHHHGWCLPWEALRLSEFLLRSDAERQIEYCRCVLINTNNSGTMHSAFIIIIIIIILF